MGKQSAPRNLYLDAVDARGKFLSRVTSLIKAAVPRLQTRPGRPAPGGKRLLRVRALKSGISKVGMCHTPSQEISWADRLTSQRLPASQPATWKRASKIFGAACIIVSDSARARLTAS